MKVSKCIPKIGDWVEMDEILNRDKEIKILLELPDGNYYAENGSIKILNELMAVLENDDIEEWLTFRSDFLYVKNKKFQDSILVYYNQEKECWDRVYKYKCLRRSN
jgi:hypothetical protein